MRQRLAPFLDLLDARYLPLLFVAAPQAYTVFAWLIADGAPYSIAVLGAIGFEFVSVGAIAWAERGAGWAAARPPAVTALLFSVAVAVAHYGPTSGAMAVLHAGFPIVGYAYMVMMHAPHVAARHETDALRHEVTRLQSEVTQATQATEDARHALTHEAQRVTQAERQAADMRQRLSDAQAEMTQLQAELAQAVERASDGETDVINLSGAPWSVRRLGEVLEVPEATLRRKLGKAREA
jgi:hypothetical protein